ncbi:MAG: hypothetical protein HQ582_02690 [Planctomycetes bacterium]|nr:hypothetical protein [Planctomycetota bacterium]
MLLDKDLLFERIIGAPGANDDLQGVIKPATLATIRSKYSTRKELSVSLGLLCKLASARGVEPALAILSLVADRLKSGRDVIDDEDLAKEVHGQLNMLATCLAEASQRQKQGCGRTLKNFPGAFDAPFLVVTGDRRESSGSKLTPADAGVVSSSAADLRYLNQLGLPRDTQIITDKTFVLTPYNELCERFANQTLICIGSPASNHLSRILNRYCIHRYNLMSSHYEEVEKFIAEAWRVGTGQDKRRSPAKSTSPHPADEIPFFAAPAREPHFDAAALEDFFEQRLSDVKWLRHSTFGGGMIDPTYPKRVRALDKDRDRDFAIVTLAQNPFRQENDGRFPALFLAGYHLPGTCYALHETVWGDREAFFCEHPYGGVLRVELKPPTHRPDRFYSFLERMENFRVEWDVESDYTAEDLRGALGEMSGESHKNYHMSNEEVNRLRVFVDGLTEADPPGAGTD